MVDIISGATHAPDVLQDQRVIDMEAATAWLDQDTYIFEHLTRKFSGLKPCKRMKHEFRERRLLPMTTTVSAGGAAIGATSIPVADANLGRTDVLIYAPATGEMFAMDEDVGGTAVADEIKVRKLDSASGTGIELELSEGDVLLVLTESHAEGEAIPEAWMGKEELITTYCYQFDRTRKNTDIDQAEEDYGEAEINKARRQFWIEQKRALNMMLYVGKEVRETASAGVRRHSMRGLIDWTSDLAIDATAIPAGLTTKTIGEMIRPTKNHGSSSMEKYAIPGQNAWSAISSFADGLVEMSNGASQTFGVTINRLITPFGNVNLAYDWQLSEENELGDYMFILDLPQVQQLQMQTLPLVLKTGIQKRDDIHNVVDVITGTRGLQVKLPELHRQVYGITA